MDFLHYCIFFIFHQTSNHKNNKYIHKLTLYRMLWVILSSYILQLSTQMVNFIFLVSIIEPNLFFLSNISYTLQNYVIFFILHFQYELHWALLSFEFSRLFSFLILNLFHHYQQQQQPQNEPTSTRLNLKRRKYIRRPRK